MMKTLLWMLLVAAVAVLCRDSAFGGEFVVVSAPQAYLLDDQYNISATVPFNAVLDASGEKEKFLLVEYQGKQLQLHPGFVHRWNQIEFINEQNSATARRVYELMSQADRDQENEDAEAELSKLQKAVKIAQQEMPQATPLIAYAIQKEAFFHYRHDNLDLALQRLEQAGQSMKELGMTEHLYAAEVHNVRAIVLESQEKYDEAISEYEQAVLITTNCLGARHADIANIYSNFATNHYKNGDFKNAIFCQKMATNAWKAILPKSATEHAEASNILGDYFLADEQYEAALQEYDQAITFYQDQHPDELDDIGSFYINKIYTKRQMGDIEGAKEQAKELLDLTEKMKVEDARYYKRDALLRLGSIAYEADEYDQALQYYTGAVAAADAENLHYEDGVALESLGSTQVAKEMKHQAKETYRKAIKVYALTNGPDSDEVLGVREQIDDIDSFRDESLGGYVLIPLPHAYISTDNGTAFEKVPALSLLPWSSGDDQSHFVTYRNKLEEIPNTQLLLRRQLPGYGFAEFTEYQAIMADAAQGLQSLSDGDAEAAKKEVQSAIDQCVANYGEGNSLHLWLRLLKAVVVLRTDGPQTAGKIVEEVSRLAEEFNPNAYPIAVDIGFAKAAIAIEQEEAQAAIDAMQPARDLAIEFFGEDHMIAREARRLLGKAYFLAGEIASAADELQEASRISQHIFPPGVEEASEDVSDLAMVLTQAGELEEAAEVLDAYLNVNRVVPYETHLTMLTEQGRLYVRMDRFAEARKLFTTVTDLVKQSGEKEPIFLAASVAFYELGTLNLRDENWLLAKENFEHALDVLAALKLQQSFDAAEVHRVLAITQQKLRNPKAAQVEFNQALAIFEALGATESPGAEKIRQQLQKIMDAAPANPAPTAAQMVFLAKHFDLMPEGQAMYVTRARCSVYSEAKDGALQIGQLDANQCVWSLEQTNGFHKVYYSEAEKFGWASNAQLQLHEEYLVAKAATQLAEKFTGKRKTLLQETANAMDRARALRNGDDLMAAIAATEEALKMLRSNGAEYSLAVSLLSCDLLTLYQRTGQEDKAIKLGVESLVSFYLDPINIEHPATLNARLMNARFSREIGDFSSENNQMEAVVKNCIALFGPNDLRTKTQQLGLAASLVHTGYLNLASEMYQKIQDSEPAGSQPSFIRASTHLGLGGLLASGREHAAAIKDLDAAINEYEALGNPVPALVAQAQLLLSYCHAQQGEFDIALEVIERAENAPLGPAESGLALSIRTLKTRIAAASGNSNAIDYIDDTFNFGNEVFGDENFLLADNWQTAGMAWALTGETPVDSQRAFERSRQMSYRYAADIVAFQPTKRQLGFFSDDAKRLNESLAFTMNSNAKGAAEATAEWLINGNDRSIEFLTLDRSAVQKIDRQSDQWAARKWLNCCRDIALVPQGEKTDHPREYLKAEIAKRNAKADEAFRALSNNAKSLVIPNSDWISLDAWRKQLRQGEVAVAMRRIPIVNGPLQAAFPDEARMTYVAWVIPAAGSGKVQVIPLASEQEVERSLKPLQQHVSDTNRVRIHSGDAPKFRELEEQLLNKLAMLVWKPINAAIPTNTTHLSLCPSGLMHDVPWAAIPDSDNGVLLNRFVIRYLPALRDVQYASSSQTTNAPLMMVNPDRLRSDESMYYLNGDDKQDFMMRINETDPLFDKTGVRKAMNTQSPIAEGAFGFLAGSRGFAQSGKSGDTLDEYQMFADSIAKAFGDRANSLSGGDASEYKYFTKNRPKALHIGATTFADIPVPIPYTGQFASCEARDFVATVAEISQCNPLFQCGIMLAGHAVDDARHHGTDGVLTGAEIVLQDLRNTELVTLSSAPLSQTGGPARQDAIGVLPQSFLAAGAKSVLSGAWPQSRELTWTLIDRFYRNIASGKGKAEALRLAQLEIREKISSKIGYAPVSFWASFRITGQGWDAR